MSIALDPIMMLRAVNENFMNQVQVVESLYGRFDPHTLGILGDGDFHDRKGDLKDVMRAYGNLRVEIGTDEYFMALIEEVIDLYEEGGEKREVIKWKGALLSFDRHLARNQVLIGMAHSLLALYRNMALVETFAETKKRGSFIGITKEKITEMLSKRKPKDKSEPTGEDIDSAKNDLDKMWDEAASMNKDAKIDNVAIV